MNINKSTKEWIKYGCQSKASRKKAIQSALFVVAALTNEKTKHISAKELNKLFGGTMYQTQGGCVDMTKNC